MPDLEMYESYKSLAFERHEDGVLVMTMMSRGPDLVMHTELSTVWDVISRDSLTSVAVVTGGTEKFCAVGDQSIPLMEASINNFETIAEGMKEARKVVLGMVDCPKPIVSAINGDATGVGLALALLADVSITADDATFIDPHLDVGLAAGDHAAMVWPLLCGMAKAKYYLMTCDALDGREAERIGLVAKSVARADVVPTAMEIAQKLARGPRLATQWTKHALNHWLRQATPTFELSLALETMGMFDNRNFGTAITAMKAGQTPTFPPTE